MVLASVSSHIHAMWPNKVCWWRCAVKKLLTHTLTLCVSAAACSSVHMHYLCDWPALFST